jgi:hypothetical protein
VPGGFREGEEIPEAARAQIRTHWDSLIAKAKQVKVGDAVSIGYQRDKITISGVHVTHIVGAGSLSITKGAGKE